MPPITLQPPEWREVPEFCAGCGYALQGLASPGSCPECGLRFDEQTLVMIGIPRRGSTTSPMRRVLWGVVLVGGVVWLNGLGFMAFEPTVFLVLGLGWLIGLIALLATGKRERSATQPLIFSAGGFGLASDAQTDAGRTLQTWAEVDGYRFTRLGAKWYRLQLGHEAPHRRDDPSAALRTVTFEAGVRCSDEDADRVRETLTHHLQQKRVYPQLP